MSATAATDRHRRQRYRRSRGDASCFDEGFPAAEPTPKYPDTRGFGSWRLGSRPLEVGPDDLLFDAEHAARLRIHVHLYPVNQAFAVGLQPGEEQVCQRLFHEEEVVVTVREHHRPGVLLRPHLEACEEALESAGAVDWI